jgi:hypothetical protein|tara:strand:+ start:1001 stop:1396 length:396 start_codon:yes stop_codon:yes gene_type:complete
MIYVYFTGRIKDKRQIIEASELMLAELCVNCDHDVDIDICLLRHLDQQMAGYCWGDSEMIHIEIARNSEGTQFMRDDILLHLTHELVHAKQLIEKQFVPRATPDIPYMELPWEQEAFGLEAAMCKKYFKIG